MTVLLRMQPQIGGNSVRPGFVGWIEALSFEPVAAPPGPRGEPAVIRRARVRRRADGVSPALREAALKGTRFVAVDVVLLDAAPGVVAAMQRASGPSPRDRPLAAPGGGHRDGKSITIRLKLVIVTDYSISGPQSAAHHESYQLNFTKIEYHWAGGAASSGG